MTGILDDPRAVWALVLVAVLPLVTIAAGELDERLRQRDSDLRPALSVIRWWVIPLATAWAVVRGLLNMPASDVVARLVATGLWVSLAAAALSAFAAVARRIHGRADQSRRRVPQLLLALPRVGILLVAGWILVDRVWGVNLSAAVTALGVTSLVVSFALQDTLSGLASGMLLLTDAPFRPGDWVRSEDLEGRVVDVNWRSTRIENRDGDVVVVPNAQLAGTTIVNFDRPTRLHRVVVPVQVAYANPPTLARDMLLDAARSTPNVLEEPAPDTRVVQVDDPLMGYEVDLWIDDFRLAPRVASDFGALVWYASHRHDVPLPSPAFDLYVYDGVATTQAARPDRADVRRRVLSSPLLAQLDDADVDQLLEAATPERFARGETILTGPRAARGDLHVLWRGRARIVVTTSTGEVLEVGELVPGEVFGFLGRTARTPVAPSVVAIDDCEVVIVEAGPAGEVISRNPALSTALEQISSMRRRRVERLTAGETPHDGQAIGVPRGNGRAG